MEVFRRDTAPSEPAGYTACRQNSLAILAQHWTKVSTGDERDENDAGGGKLSTGLGP
jgi:hypothetical protein